MGLSFPTPTFGTVDIFDTASLGGGEGGGCSEGLDASRIFFGYAGEGLQGRVWINRVGLLILLVVG